ncbi:MAG: shikimate dehydrogenase [Planctomycetes bacterium]|nr:shikimate dehydrogenase [Planctomycetota bacterium]
MFDTKQPIICAVIGRTRHRMMQAEIQEAAKQGAKLIELRLDFLAKPPDFKRLLTNRPCPMIATLRRPSDGGRFAGSEEQRFMLIRQAVVAGFDFIDLEHDIIKKIPRFGKVRRIVSYHNIQGIPENLEAIHEAMCAEDADIVKIVVTAQQPSDNLRLLALLRKASKPTVAFCMGDLGTCSRVLGLRMGMPFTYAAFNKERQIAPGMLSYQEMQKIYRVESVNGDTKVFGVIGDPVSHSHSSLIHNAALEKLGINAVYLPFRVPRGELPAFLKSFREIPVEGYSVTLPHKEAAAKLAQDKDESVTTMGAANTLVATEADFRAVNTDAQAALDSLQAHLPSGPDGKPVPLASRSVLIVGAGGVARAIAFALRKENVPMTLTNRTPERGEKLATDVGCRFVDWAARHNVECDTVINCTSVGMHPNIDDSPIHHSFLKAGLFIFDTIYTPETTKLIREAQARGCQVLTGVDMFVRQAALQFEIFTGQPAPLELMTNVVRQALSPVRAVREEAKPSTLRPATLERPKMPAGIAAASPRAVPTKPSPIVYLIGYRGTGKSTIARLLADKLGWSWIDADEFLQARHGKTIRQIFDEEVEKGFRDKESKLLQELSDYEDHVIATGGGVILSDENRALLKRGIVVWLQAPADVLWQRVQKDVSSAEKRPDLAQGGLAEIEELLALRAPLYEDCADFAIDTATQSPQHVAETIYTWIQQAQA